MGTDKNIKLHIVTDIKNKARDDGGQEWLCTG